MNKDQFWSKQVIERDERCMWPDCAENINSFNRLTAHHGIKRGVQHYRHDLRNGLTLCVIHHGQAEANPKEWKMTPSKLGDEWIEAGGWSHSTPGEWRTQNGIPT